MKKKYKFFAATFTYDPLVGVTRITDSWGYPTT